MIYDRHMSTTSKASARRGQATLRERIADAIRESIIRGELQPGARISEPRLAKKYGISRTPVREALRQLDSEGFLGVVPRKGARVSIVTERDVNEFYELRSLLEGYAAELATRNISDRELHRLEQLNEQMECFHRSGEFQRIARLHRQFHEIIVQAAHNEQLSGLLHSLNNRFQRFMIQLALSGKNAEAFSQHRDIIQAMRQRDGKLAEQTARANAMLGRELMIQELQERKTSSCPPASTLEAYAQ